MSYTKWFPRDTTVMAQNYDDYDNRDGKPFKVLDFSPLVRAMKTEDNVAKLFLPERLAEAVAEKYNEAYELGQQGKALSTNITWDE